MHVHITHKTNLIKFKVLLVKINDPIVAKILLLLSFAVYVKLIIIILFMYIEVLALQLQDIKCVVGSYFQHKINSIYVLCI